MEVRSLVRRYDAFIRQLAEQPVRQRFKAQHRLLALSGFGFFAVQAALEIFPAPSQVRLFILVSTGALFIVWLCYTGSRFVRYSVAYDRTPADAPWAETPEGLALVKALQRVSLNDLRALTLQTRLRSGMKLTSADMSQLFRILAEEGRLDPSAGEVLKAGDPAIADMLDGLAGQVSHPKTP